MSPMNRMIDACLASAARRWPVSLGDTMAREWRAEIDAVRRDPHARPLVRIWRQLAFALSLACSPSPESEHGAAIGWRGRVAGLGPGTLRTLALIGVGLLAGLINSLIGDVNGVVLNSFGHGLIYRTFGWWHGDPPLWLSAVTNCAATAAAITAMALLGRFAARRLSPPPVTASPLSVAARMVLPIAAGFLLRYPAFGRGYLRYLWYQQRDISIGLIEGTGAWIVLALVVSTAVIYLVRAGRRTTARVTALGGLLITADLTGMFAGLANVLKAHQHVGSAPEWLPYALGIGLPLHGDGAVMTAYRPVYMAAVPLLYLTAFLATFVIMQITAAPAPAAGTATTVAAVVPRSSWVAAQIRGFAVSVGGAGFALWAYALAVSPQRIPYTSGARAVPRRLFQTTELIECRALGIVLLLLAFVVYNAGRGPIAAPTGTIGVVLGVTDGLLIRSDLRGPTAAAIAVLIGGLTAAGAWWFLPRLTGPGTTDTTARRALVFTAIVAAFAVPTTIRWDMLGGFEPYTDTSDRVLRSAVPLSVLILVAGVILVLTALVAALASRTERLSRAGVATAALVVFGLLFSVSIGRKMTDRLFYPDPRFFIQPVIAVVLIGIARWRRSARPVRAIVTWCGYAIGAALATMPLLGPVTQLQGYVIPLTTPRNDDYALAPLVFGVLVALLVTKRATPSDDVGGIVVDSPVTLSPATA